jgi:hypothetical protein
MSVILSEQDKVSLPCEHVTNFGLSQKENFLIISANVIFCKKNITYYIHSYIYCSLYLVYHFRTIITSNINRRRNLIHSRCTLIYCSRLSLVYNIKINVEQLLLITARMEFNMRYNKEVFRSNGFLLNSFNLRKIDFYRHITYLKCNVR